MSEQREYTPEQEAQITQRIGYAFDFLSDVLENPAILSEIPDGATLRFSEVVVNGVTCHLTAFRAKTPGEPAQWFARVTSPPAVAAAPLLHVHRGFAAAEDALQAQAQALIAAAAGDGATASSAA